MKKRVLCMLLALVMSLSLAVPAFAAEEQVPSADVTEAPAAEAPVEEPAEAPVEEPAEEPAEAPVEEPAEEPTEEPTEPAPDGTVVVDAELVEGSVADAVADEPVSVDQTDVVIADEPDGGIMTIDSTANLKTNLDAAITTAEAAQKAADYEKKYTDASRTALQTALDAAKALQKQLNDGSITVDDKAMDIFNATNTLEKAAKEATAPGGAGLDPFATAEDIAALEKAYNDAQTVSGNKDTYMEDGWEAFDQAVGTASSLLNQGANANRLAVLSATDDIKNALKDLKENKVTAQLLKVGYYPTQSQATQALTSMNGGSSITASGDYEMYALIKKPDRANDSHKYYLEVKGQTGTYTIQEITFNAAGDQVVNWNGLTALGLTKDAKTGKVANGTSVTCTLYSYTGTFTNVGLKKQQVGQPMTITISDSYEGPYFLASGCGWARAGTSENPSGNNVMQIALDSASSALGGVLLKLSDGTSEEVLKRNFVGSSYSWTWDENNGSYNKAPEGLALKVGTYTVNLYPYVVNGDGSTTASTTAADSVQIKVPAVDVSPLQLAYDAKVKEYPDLETKWVPKANVDALKKALDAAKKLLDAAASTPDTLKAYNDVNAAIEAINEVPALTEKADYSKLDAAISNAQAILDANRDLATSDTLSPLITALAKANGLSRDLTKAEQDQIDAVVKVLNEAVDNLQEKPANWNGFDSKLLDARNRLNSANNYTAASKQALQTAVDAATAFKAANGGLTMSNQDLVNAQADALDAAIKGLQLRANTANLSTAITKAEGLDQSKYVDCTAVLSALKTAKDLLATDPDSSKQADVNAAAKALNDAIAALEEIHVTGEHNATEGGRWQQTGGTWYWIQANGSVLKDSWLVYKGQWYYLAQGSGAMATGWAKVDDLWYWFDGSGAMQTGWLKDGGLWYFLSGSGAMLTGWVKVGGQMYYLNPTQGENGLPEGGMVTGWLQSAGAWYWLNPSSGAHGLPEGAMVSNDWQYTGGLWYWLNANGDMAKGWKAVRGVWYYLNPTEGENGLPEGGMFSNKWLLDDGKWYYLGSSGAMYANNAYTIGGQVYRFNGSGVMLTGWFQNGNWYYYNKGGNGLPEGALIKSKWINTDDNWFYVDGEGVMLTGMQTINGKEYYLTAAGDNFGLPLGAMATNRWVTVGTTRRYYGPDGVLVTSTTNTTTTVTGNTGTAGNTVTA